ncbi:MAG: glycosyltransferase family 2 protein [Elusimicrobiales bacterium]|nr:glycosyltransferase family 2 protein [Elusimicrobiales bacterium]
MNKSEPAGRFSVVTPTYNMGRYLAATIESVIANMRPGDEYFIIDGGSTDDTLDVIRSYEKRITGWVSEPDSGYGDALRKGFAMASGEFQCYINSGDVLLSGALDVARECFQGNDADFLFGDDVYIGEDGLVIFYNSGAVSNLKNFMLFGGWTPLQDACFWRKTVFSSAGSVDPSLRYAVDYDLFLRYSLQGKCLYLPIVFSAFLKHDGQKSRRYYAEYAIEREKCRERELCRVRYHWGWKMLLSGYYWSLVRIRAYFIAPMLRRLTQMSEIPVRTLNCGRPPKLPFLHDMLRVCFLKVI